MTSWEDLDAPTVVHQGTRHGSARTGPTSPIMSFVPAVVALGTLHVIAESEAKVVEAMEVGVALEVKEDLAGPNLR